MKNKTQTSTSEKVVVRIGSESICGYVDTPSWNTIEDVFVRTLPGNGQTLSVRVHESEAVEDVLVADVKAIFFVNSFEGNPVRDHINFHMRAPVTEGVWIRLQFYDGEVMEGIVHNSMRYLVEPGFFLLPTDPESNNRFVYVLKKSLVDYRVLGLRKI